ncbi:MAG: malto-oligosyltrehalose synthase [Methylobacterium mesophilicum]|nr:malto-oligosyltrehalose synthase [Methylobacterium mesophilicum]
MTLPRATYRLQFREGMTFDRAVGLVPYLKKLGISHLYASPIFTAPKGSTHGYDVADHNEIDPFLGGREGFDRLSAALKSAGLGLVLDIVPNHMAASLENPWWRSVVEWGEDSPYAQHFDIDWQERLTLPNLGKTFEDAAEDGEIRLAFDAQAGALALGYYETLVPLHPRTYGEALAAVGHPLKSRILDAAKSAAPNSNEFHETLRGLAPDEGFTAELEKTSTDPGFLKQIHDAQPWKLTFWKEAREHLSYRRFFEVTGLAGVRVEDPRIFDDVHRLTLELVENGQLDGLRIDHVDGLADPRAYLARLREKIGPDTYLVVEKILGEEEQLPADWPIEGTTGYEFAVRMPELFVEEAGLKALAHSHDTLLGRHFDPETERAKAKRQMVTHNFATELKGLARMAAGLSDGQWSEEALAQAIAALIVAFPTYRTYGDRNGMPESDQLLLAKSAQKADKADLDALGFVLKQLNEGKGEGAGEFRVRFQQLTGPATAKSVEDTLFYRANALIAMNEVGGEPEQGVGSVARFHEAMLAHARRQPHGLLGSSTHDTKRGEDARARLFALSEAPDEWAQAVARWRVLNKSRVEALEKGPAPEPETEWLLYQALAGLWPDETDLSDKAALDALRERFAQYVEKALREAKLRTGWSDPDEAYENAVKAYADHLLDPANRDFLSDFTKTLAPFVQAGKRNSLAQTLIKLTAPGVPDIYQGTEGWDLSLVDPDNRRAPDFSALAQRLDAVKNEPAAWEPSEKGKLALTAAMLAFREKEPEFFEQASYKVLEIEGQGAEKLGGFVREHDGKALLVLVSRLTLKGADWAGTEIVTPAREWVDVERGKKMDGGERLSVSALLGDRPVALLWNE